MSKYAGKSFLLYSEDTSGSGTYGTLVSHTTGLTHALNNALVESTDKGSNNKTEYIDGAGVSSESVSVEGRFNDDAIMATIKSRVKARTAWNYRLAFPDGTTETGLFLFESLEFSGAHDDAMAFSASLVSSGAITSA